MSRSCCGGRRAYHPAAPQLTWFVRSPSGEKGIGKMGKPLHFKGSAFHRVIPQFMCARASRARASILVAVCTPHRAVLTRDANRCQGGDFTAGNGTGAQPRSAARACEACPGSLPQLTHLAGQLDQVASPSTAPSSR